MRKLQKKSHQMEISVAQEDLEFLKCDDITSTTLFSGTHKVLKTEHVDWDALPDFWIVLEQYGDDDVQILRFETYEYE